MGHTLVLNTDGLPIGVLPLSSLHWQDAVKAVYLGTVSVLHTYDNWKIHSPSCEFFVPSVVMAREYVKVRRFVGFSPEMVHLRDAYRCQYCGDKFHSSHLTMDHVLPKSMGGKLVFSNVVSSCSPCNSRRGNDVRIQPRNAPYRPTYGELMSKRRKYTVTVPHVSWVDYIGWPEELVRIEQPTDVPGYIPYGEEVENELAVLLQQATG